MSDRIGAIRVEHHLRKRSRSGREIEEKSVGDPRHEVGAEACGGLERLLVRNPAVRLSADDDFHEASREPLERAGVLGRRDDERHLSTGNPVLKVALRQEKRRRDEDRAELDGGQDRLPQLRLVVKHEKNAAPALKPLPPEEVRDAVRALPPLGERVFPLAPLFVDDPERRAVVSFRPDVEVVEGPVELLELGPAEAAVRRLVVIATLLQEVASLEKPFPLRIHRRSPTRSSDSATYDSRTRKARGETASGKGRAGALLCRLSPRWSRTTSSTRSRKRPAWDARRRRKPSRRSSTCCARL